MRAFWTEFFQKRRDWTDTAVKVIKIAGGTFFSMVIAEGLGLNYSASAGVITLLSIYDTKKETFRIVAKRLAAFLTALCFGRLCFALLGFGPAAIGLFLLCFTPVCIRLNLQEGISVSTVLMTHFLTESGMTGAAAANELMLLLIGTSTGMALNLYIPGRQKLICSRQKEMEEQFRKILSSMAEMLKKEADRREADGLPALFETLEEMIKAGEKEAFFHMENHLLSETKYYLRYMGMRKNQLSVLRQMDWHLRQIKEIPGQAKLAAELFKAVSSSFHESNNAEGLLLQSHELKDRMKEQSLPVSREEFESRAVLFLILLEMEQFLKIKKSFAEELTEKERRKFWHQKI